MSTTLLADYGADVVKVEPPGRGDSLRQLAPFNNDIPLWWKVNARNKRCVALDLKDPDDLATFYELVKVADVVVENYSVGTAADLHVNYESLREINPHVIMLSVSGYGQTGPYSHRRAFGRTAEAFSGLAHVTGYSDKPPGHSAFPVADEVTGVFGALAVLAAVYERDQNPSREGQYIDLALYEAPFRLMEFIPIKYDQLGETTERGGFRVSYVCPSGTWATSDDHFICFTGSTEEIVRRLFRAIDRDDLIKDERFSTNAARVQNRDDLEPIITEWVAEHSLESVVKSFDTHDVAFSSYMNIADIFQDPHYKDRGSIVEVEDEDLGTVRMQGVAPKFGRTPGSIRHTGRTKIGSDQEDVLQDWLHR
jgi:crotonobetainyl-CoA:carnitine CoA-transferase CaiB-like acyl-CoA transferase